MEEILKRLGFTDTEIKLYLTGLQLGSSTATELAKAAGIKRTTTHSALLSMEEKGLVGGHEQAGKKLYTMEAPQVLERRYVEAIDALKGEHLDFLNALPLFDAFTKTGAQPTEVSSFSGKEGVKSAVDAALYCSSRHWKIIAPKRNYFSEGGTEYGDYFIKIRRQRQIKARSLWERSFIKGRTFSETAFTFRDPRLIPKHLEGKFKSTLILFDESVLFINSAKEDTAVLIRSKEINDTMSVFFEGLWALSKPIPKSHHRAQ